MESTIPLHLTDINVNYAGMPHLEIERWDFVQLVRSVVQFNAVKVQFSMVYSVYPRHILISKKYYTAYMFLQVYNIYPLIGNINLQYKC